MAVRKTEPRVHASTGGLNRISMMGGNIISSYSSWSEIRLFFSIDPFADQRIAVRYAALIRFFLGMLARWAVSPLQGRVQVIGLDDGEVLAGAIGAGLHLIAAHLRDTRRSQHFVVVRAVHPFIQLGRGVVHHDHGM